MNNTPTCRICGLAARIGQEDEGSPFFAPQSCQRCGTYYYDHTTPLQPGSDGSKVRLAGWVRQQNAAGVQPKITQDIARRVEAMPMLRFRERSALALSVIARKYPAFLAPPTTIVTAEHDPELWGVSFSANGGEVRQLLRILESEQLIELRSSVGGPPTDFRLTAKGLLAADDMAATTTKLAQGFVAMSFDLALQDAWLNGFDPGIRAAGFRPFRIDNKDYVGGITDEIMSEVRRSRFVVTDYTGQKNGVYFEAGFALGLGLTVIPTCRSDEVSNLHFDIKHLNTLLWHTPGELMTGLSKRIRAVIGVGPDLT
jgi:hypothetical protein